MPLTRDEVLAFTKTVNAGSGQRVHEAESAVGELFSALETLRSLGHTLSVELTRGGEPGDEWPKMLYEKPKDDGTAPRTAIVYSEDEAKALDGEWSSDPHPATPTDPEYPHRVLGGTPHPSVGLVAPGALEDAHKDGEVAAGAGVGPDANPNPAGGMLAQAWLDGFLGAKGAKPAPSQGQEGPAGGSGPAPDAPPSSGGKSKKGADAGP